MLRNTHWNTGQSFQYMAEGNMHKNKTRPSSLTTTKINAKQIKDLSDYKTCRRKYKGNASGHWNGREFFRQDP